MRASIGIAIAERPQVTPDDLLRDADLAMYVAKRNGKGRFEMYRPKMHEDAVRLLETEVGIREGLDSDQFEVFYQPIVNAQTRSTQLPQKLWCAGTTRAADSSPPVEFIGIAEDTGLIVPLGGQVLCDAARQAQSWRQGGQVDDDFYVSVNLSAHQLQESDLVNSVARALDRVGTPPGGLVLEVTESALIENLAVTVPRLLALRSWECASPSTTSARATRRSSYLADLPDQLRQDRQVLRGSNHVGFRGVAVVRGVIDLSRAMGFTCIAEGVEQEDQRNILDELGCEYLQGYLFGPPESAVNVSRTITNLRHGRPLALADRH